MYLRKIEGREDAEACLASAEASGLLRAEWARRNGISPRSLQAWRMVLTRRKTGVLPHAPAMVELVAMQPSAVGRYVIRCGMFAVEVDGSFEEPALRRLLAVIRSC
jgi:hypothetical protein